MPESEACVGFVNSAVSRGVSGVVHTHTHIAAKSLINISVVRLYLLFYLYSHFYILLPLTPFGQTMHNCSACAIISSSPLLLFGLHATNGFSFFLQFIFCPVISGILMGFLVVSTIKYFAFLLKAKQTHAHTHIHAHMQRTKSDSRSYKVSERELDGVLAGKNNEIYTFLISAKEQHKLQCQQQQLDKQLLQRT